MWKPQRPVSTVAAVVVLAALAALTWWVFLGQDTTYQLDSSGQMGGPYEAPQVVGCALTLGLLTVIGALILPDWVVIVTISLAFTVAWSINASSDITGLWVLGAIEVLLGSALGIWLVVFLTGQVKQLRRARP